MTQEYTLSEAQKKLRTDNKTLQRWITLAKDAGVDMEPHPNPGNQSQKLLTRAQLEYLAAEHGRKLTADPPVKEADPVATLERKLRREFEQKLDEKIEALRQELLAHIEETAAQPALPAPVQFPALPAVSSAKPATTIAAEDAITFLVKHQANRKAVIRWRPLPDGERELLKFALARRQPLQRCDQAEQGCPCKELLPEA